MDSMEEAARTKVVGGILEGSKEAKLEIPVECPHDGRREKHPGALHANQHGHDAHARNSFSHGDEDQRSPREYFEMLRFLNCLFQQLPA
jgi:hypothetical protein